VTGSTKISAVLWDFGGVILTSPFEAFNRLEGRLGVPRDTIRRINATDPDTNAWARFERNDISAREFDTAFAAEASNIGFSIRGADVLMMLDGDIRPEMVRALDLVKAAGYKTACLTNNMAGANAVGERPASDRRTEIDVIMERFDVIVESSKVGVRKPEPRFYEIACGMLAVSPAECVFLDDLGVNLKPAAAMGMRTIKVVQSEQAIDDLEAILGVTLR